MPSEIFSLFLLIQAKDYASVRLNHVEAQLRSLGKEGKQTLQTFQQLREGVQRGLTIGGIGIGGLMLLKKGVDEAADFEAALLDLKSAYQETSAAGALSAQEQESQLRGLGVLAVDLGNKLQGNTKDYAGILASLKQSGLTGDQVVGGAGRSAAYLANVSGALRQGRAREQAKELGQFGIMFKLRPDEFENSVNLFSALKDKFDIESGSLIESAKYFQATSNQLGITGAKGAGDTVKFFALLKRTAGMEGSEAGTGARAFFMQLATEEKKLAKLKKATGIELKPFDEKGMFRGFEAMFSEMEKFRSLSQQQSAKWLNEIFGLRGQEVASAMVSSGAEGWKKITAESAKAVPVNEKINQQMETYLAKMEALEGSWQNLKSTAFTPLMNEAKPIVDRLNAIVGASQEWSGTHPGLTKIAGDLATIGAVTLTVYGTVKAGTTAWQLYTLALSSAGVATQAQTVGVLSPFGLALDKAGDKVSTLTNRMRGAGLLSPMALTISVLAVGEGLKVLADWREMRAEERRNAEESADLAESLSRPLPGGAVLSSPDLSRQLVVAREKLSQLVPGTDAARPVETEIARLQNLLQPFQERQLQAAEAAKKAWLSLREFAPTPAAPVFGTLGLDYPDPTDILMYKGRRGPKSLLGASTEDEIIQKLRAMPAFQGEGSKYALAELLRQGKADQLRGVGGWGIFAGRKGESFDEFRSILKEAFPQQFAQAEQLLVQEVGSFGEQSKLATDALKSLLPPLVPLPGQFTNAGSAAQRFSDRLDGIDLRVPAPGGPSVPGAYAPGKGPISSLVIPSKASGGLVLRGGLVAVHDRESIVPARVTDRWREVAPAAPGPFSFPRIAPAQVTDRWRDVGVQRMPEFRPEAVKAIVAESRGRSEPAQVIHHHHTTFNLNVNLPPGSRAADDPEELANLIEQTVIQRLTISSERQ